MTALLCCSGALPSRGRVVISEFLTSNQSGITDEDGDTSDWIELHNAGLETVDLTGFHLTDDATDMRKWTLPSRLLAPGSHLVVFASGKDRTAPRLHANFSLFSTGEYLALTDPTGVIVHVAGNPYPPQSSDVSYGLIDPETEAQSGYFLTPTPGSSNLGATLLLPAPKFSVPAKTFVAPFAVTLTSPVPGHVIRYTLDGTVPEPSSPAYAGPITISLTTRLRARLFDGGSVASQIGGATYIHLAGGAESFTSSLPLVILDNFSGGHPANGTLAQWMVFEPDNATGRSSLTTAPALSSRSYIKVRGSSTANDPKYSLSLETRNEQDEDARVAPLGMPPDSDWVLQAPYSYDRSLIRNALAYQLSNSLGMYAPRTRQVEVFLNTDGGSVTAADYFGVFTFMEKITRGENRVDIARLRNSDATLPNIAGGYLLKIDRPDPGDQGFTAGNGQRYYFVDPKEQEITIAQRNWITSHFNTFWTTLSSPIFSDPVAGYAAFVDADSMVTHHFFNVAVKNVDALRLSTYLHKDRWGKLVWGPVWDFDRSMDSQDGRDDHFDTWRGETGDQGTDYFRHPMWLELFRDGNFWQRWIDQFGKARSGALSTPQVRAVIDSMAEELAEAQARNFARWPAVPPRITWVWEINHLKDWLTSRLDWIDQQFIRPAISNAPAPGGGLVPGGFQLTLTSPSLTRPGAAIYYTTDGSDPRAAETGQFDLPLVALDAPVKALLPASDPGPAWHGSAASPDTFDDSGWMTGSNGMGYDDSPDYDAFIGLSFEPPAPAMKNVTGSAYLRAKFTLSSTQLAAIGKLELRMRYDDGFAAFLNGVEVARENAPSTLPWNALASAGRADSAAQVQTPFNLSPFISLLHAGENVLAIHGLNYPVNSSDFLCQAELLASTAPAVAASAVAYDAPVPISGTTNLFVRVHDPTGPFAPYPYTGSGAGQVPVGSHWSAPLRLSLFTDAVPASSTSLVISEIMYHPKSVTTAEMNSGFATDDFEYLVLKNIHSQPLDLTGIHFTAGIAFSAELNALSYLPAGASVVLAANPDAFRLRHPGATLPLLGGFQGNLGDQGEMLTLRGASGSMIKEFAYSDLPPWPASADGTGFSLKLRTPDTNPPHANPASWRASQDPGGELPGTLVVDFNSWRPRHFDPASPLYSAYSAPDADPDGDGLNNFVEFATGSLPTQSTPAPLRFRKQDSLLLLEYDRRPALSGVELQIQTSASPNGPWSVAGPPFGPVTINSSGHETVSILPDISNVSRKFFRMQVSQP